jgi:hypothetical protein
LPQAVVENLDIMTSAHWDFRGGEPSWSPPRQNGRLAVFDCFPGYRHDGAVAVRTLAVAAATWPPAWDITAYLADREETSRTNGFSHLHSSGHYEGDDWVTDDPAGTILLSGKRVPPHPAMTAYLVGHEYGHHVEWMINQANGAKVPQSHDLAAEYLNIRHLGAASDHHGSGGNWHSSVHEILACDFRVLVLGVEARYWPHPGIPEPHEVPGLREWWEAATDKARALKTAAPEEIRVSI